MSRVNFQLKYGKTLSTDNTKAKIRQLLQSVAINHSGLGPFILRWCDKVELTDDFSLDAWCTIGCSMPDTALCAIELDQYDLEVGVYKSGIGADTTGKAFEQSIIRISVVSLKVERVKF